MARTKKSKLKKAAKKTAKMIMKWVVTRGVEPTTWLGLGGIAGVLGYNAPEWAALAYKIAAGCAALAMILGEKGSKPNPGNKMKIS